MNHAIVQQLVTSLRNLDLILAKAAAHAEARKFNPDNYLGLRLAPDMLPFSAQIRIACDGTKAVAAALAGVEPPRHEDNEATFAEIRGRIGRCVGWIDSLPKERFEQADLQATYRLAFPAGKGMKLGDYLVNRQIPNVYFHIVTAYAILRAAGVELGKADYLGSLPTFDV